MVRGQGPLPYRGVICILRLDPTCYPIHEVKPQIARCPRSVLDLMRECPSLSISPERFLSLMPPLKSRVYSISSSNLVKHARAIVFIKLCLLMIYVPTADRPSFSHSHKTYCNTQMHADEVHATYRVCQYRSRIGELREGVCTTWMRDLRPASSHYSTSPPDNLSGRQPTKHQLCYCHSVSKMV